MNNEQNRSINYERTGVLSPKGSMENLVKRNVLE